MTGQINDCPEKRMNSQDQAIRFDRNILDNAEFMTRMRDALATCSNQFVHEIFHIQLGNFIAEQAAPMLGHIHWKSRQWYCTFLVEFTMRYGPEYDLEELLLRDGMKREVIEQLMDNTDLNSLVIIHEIAAAFPALSEDRPGLGA